jgi:hypothetical protein
MLYRALRRYADGGISSMRAASVGPVQSVDLTRRNVPPLIILCHRLVNTVAWIPDENTSGAMLVRLSSARTDALLFVKSAVLQAISLPQREGPEPRTPPRVGAALALLLVVALEPVVAFLSACMGPSRSVGLSLDPPTNRGDWRRVWLILIV